jgi:hypothetical protein
VRRAARRRQRRRLPASHPPAQPGLGRRFVFVTGDIAALDDSTQEFGEMPVLTKPFTATDLDRVLGDAEVGV